MLFKVVTEFFSSDVFHDNTLSLLVLLNAFLSAPLKRCSHKISKIFIKKYFERGFYELENIREKNNL